jgi:alpha-amylase
MQGVRYRPHNRGTDPLVRDIPFHTTLMNRILLALCAALVVLVHPAAAQQATPGTEWWRSSVCYQVFVRSFFDSDGDGTGDLRGLIQKLDHINDGDPSTRRDLGADCIWLMPIAQSPSYHGYDVKNYYHVERSYGTNQDFRDLMTEAHRRGIRVIVDLVPNHSSNQHPFFKDALLNPASQYRTWYQFSPTDPGTRGPWGQQVWHRNPLRDEYYFGLFIVHMPDLNLANPAVTEEMKNVARYWLQEMGVDGFRIDAVAHLFEEGTQMKHVPQNHAWLRDYAAFIRQVSPNAFTVGEVWDSTGAMLPYYPDQLDSYFAFEVADGILNAVQSGSPERLFAAVARAQRDIPEGRWAPFVRNHDQTRTMTVLNGDVNRARLATSILLTLPGTPFLYYGEEIGMTGDKIPGPEPDMRLRTPMHWRRAPSAGFTTGVPWEPLQPDSLSANVEAQEADPGSLLNLHRRLIHTRRANPALARGDWLPLTASEGSAMAFLRRHQGENVLVLINLGDRPLSRVALSAAAGALPAGRYAATALEGGARPATLRVAAGGGIQGWRPLGRLEPYGVHIIRLSSN